MAKSRILILCKTYPNPSKKYIETSCVAGMTEDYKLIRLYPVPYRFLKGEQQFKKWQWIICECNKRKKDPRLESYTINIDAIKINSDPISSNHGWRDRLPILEKLCQLHSFQNAANQGKTLALIKPTEIVGFDITPIKDQDWTDKELEKLQQSQQQDGLFENTYQKEVPQLEKIPYNFYYRYLCEENGQQVEKKHMVLDWEIGALYRNCRKSHGENWQVPFRKKMEESLVKKDIIFLMGTHSRWPVWMIISLFYPPKSNQPDLFSSF